MSVAEDISEPIAKKIRSVDSAEDNFDDPLCKDENHETQLEKTANTFQETNCTGEINEDENTLPLSNNDDDDHELFPFPPDDDITDMTEGVEYHGVFPTITDRYFTPYYKLNVQSPEDDICVLIHSNRICMLTLAPSHAIFQKGRLIAKVDFKVSDKLDRTLNKVSGKSKHGAQPLQANSNICTITSSEGKAYIIKCCIIGKLVEVNESLLQDPQLLSQPPHRGGYLAIVLPNIKLLEKMKETLLTKEQYELSISERKNVTTTSEILTV